MARYIDADALIEVLQEWRDTSSLNDGAGNPVDSILYDVIRRIEDAPTADVAPKEEVESQTINLKAVLDERAVDRAEVAREIFAKIRQCWARRLFDCGDFSFKDFAFCGFAGDLDELNKKYTEDNQ